MTRLRKIREERDNHLTVQTTLAPLGTTTAPLMWSWAARQLTGSGSFLDDEKATEPDGGRIRNARVPRSGAARR
jgi:hypothetical protein